MQSLRDYSQTNVQRELYASMRKGNSPNRRDHFVEGQVSIRSPQARNEINMLKTYQKMQVDRLAKPKQKSPSGRYKMSTNFVDAQIVDGKVQEADSPRSSYLRKTMQSFSMRRSPSLDDK